MKLKNLTVKNFKGAPDRTINLDKINVFIGMNGKGKTSTENAFRYVLTGKLPEDPVVRGKEFLSVSAQLDDGQGTTLERIYYLPDTYRINGEEVKEKAFVREVEKFKALCEANNFSPYPLRQGSNAFFLTQSDDVLWDFLLTGRTDGSRVRGVKELTVEMHDGSVFYMRKGQPSRVLLDGRRTTGKALAQYFGAIMNGNEKAFDIVTSSSVMNAMNMPDFAKFLISAVPIKVDFAKLSALAGLTPEQEKELAPIFPASPSPITTSDIAEAYKILYARRAEISKEADGWLKRSVYDGPLPIPDGASVKAELEETSGKLGAAKALEKAWKAYADAKAEREKAIASLNAWKTELAALASVQEPNADEEKRLEDEAARLRAESEEAASEIAGLERAIAPIVRMLSQLDATVCPLCDKLVCMTDKTACRNDLEESVRENSELSAKAKERLERARKAYEEVSAEKARLSERRAAFERKRQIERTIQSLEAAIPEIPAEPDPLPDVATLTDLKTRLEERLRACSLYDECLRAHAEYEKVMEVYELINSLVKKCEPRRGHLTNAVLEYVLKPFCDYANAFLKQIAGDIELSFRMDDDGLQTYCRPHGRSAFMPATALSTGEKMLVTFALMDMVSGIANSRVLVFDCVESLDADNLEALTELLLKPEVQSRYDHVLVSTVDHKSIRSMLSKHAAEINLIEF